MTTAATSLLGLALPVTGELSGTWGDTVNNSITALLDSAVAGTTTLSADADVTLTTTTLAANQAREAIILWTAAGTVTRYITAPAQSKIYAVLNKSSTQSIVLRGVGPTTGVTILAGKQAMVAWDGTDYVEISSGYVDGPATSTDNAIARFDGTDGKLLQNSVVIVGDTGNITGVGTFSSGAITSSSLTATRVLFAGTSGLIQDDADLTFNGTILTSTGFAGPLNGTVGATTANTGAFTTLTTSSTVTLNGGTANGVAYLDGSKVLTTGSALTFDGTNFGVGTASPSRFIDFEKNQNSGTVTRIGNTTSGTGAYSALQLSSSAATYLYNFSNGYTTSGKFAAGSTLLDAGGTGGLGINAESVGVILYVASTEQMRLTSTGLGIGTSSPTTNLEIRATNPTALFSNSATRYGYIQWENSGSELRVGTDGAFGIRFDTNATRRMTLDSAGNLGLGVTPSAWWSGVKAIQFGTAGAIWSSSDRADLTANAYLDSTTTLRYINNGYALRYAQESGAHTWYTAPSGTAGAAITFTQAMTLDASGNLLVGVTTAGGKLHVGYSTATGISVARFEGSRGLADNLPVVTMPFWNVANGVGDKEIATIGVLTGTSSNQTQKGQLYFSTSDGTLTERMRLDSAGNLGVGTTSPQQKVHLDSAGATYFRADAAGGNNAGLITFDGGNQAQFYNTGGAWVWTTGGTTERARIDASGNFAVGSSPPVVRFQAGGATGTTAWSWFSGNSTNPPASCTFGTLFGTNLSQGNSEANLVWGSGISSSQYFAIGKWSGSAYAEQVRIDYSGNLLVGGTSTSPSASNVNGFAVISSGYISLTGSGTSAIDCNRTNDGIIQAFRQSGNIVGNISVTASATAYNTGSDYRLKNITGPITTSGAYIDSLKPVEGTWKADGSTFVGLIAHETQEASRTTVATGTKDGADMQGMDYSSAEIIANLIAEIQSLRKRLAAAGIA